MPKDLITSSSGDQPTMSSREIAELVESRHDKVKQSIARLAARGVIADPPLGEYLDTLGRKATEYRLCKRDSYIVVAQLSPEFTARLVDRWDELERQVRQPVDIMKALDDPAFLRQALAIKNDEVEQLRAITSELAPKAVALDRLATAEGSLCLTDAAKSLQIRRADLIKQMERARWIYRRPGAKTWLAYDVKRHAGLMEHKTTTVEREDGSEKVVSQARITPKGLVKLAEVLGMGGMQ